ncbi:MAG TPA: NAD(P)/FAD-dependent oxidoreductase [Ktedonobacteraceae bacterium]|nr:NAD(P)/FAD-dependent oxidoreductase [Ktedonobacteraceae bacterium]
MWKKLALGATVTGAAFVGRKLLSDRQHRLQHASETAQAYQQARLRVLILGAGFGGLATALKLDQKLKELKDTDDASILVVDRNNDSLFTPLLWTVANGRANVDDVVVPIRAFQKGRRFHVLHAEVEGIDLARKEVQTSAGPRPYDILVIALGSHTAVADLPGLREYALPFHTPANVLQLRNHLIDAIENAHQAETEQERQEWLTFVVGGAGDTGIELAAIINDYIKTGLFTEYPWLADTSFRVIIVGRGERVLPMSEPRTSSLVRRALEKEGIEVLTGTAVKAVKASAVETSHGPVSARTLFWAAGITAPDVVAQLPVKHARNGAIMVDDHLRIPGYPNVYVIGDDAWAFDAVTHAPVPATAQAARQEGYYVGEVIAAEYMQRPAKPFRFQPLGHLALLGRFTGVAEIGPLAFGGFAAWLLWHLAYLQRIPSWARRTRLVVDWLLSAIFGPETGQLRLGTGLSESERVEAPPT